MYTRNYVLIESNKTRINHSMYRIDIKLNNKSTFIVVYRRQILSICNLLQFFFLVLNV